MAKGKPEVEPESPEDELSATYVDKTPAVKRQTRTVPIVSMCASGNFLLVAEVAEKDPRGRRTITKPMVVAQTTRHFGYIPRENAGELRRVAQGCGNRIMLAVDLFKLKKSDPRQYARFIREMHQRSCVTYPKNAMDSSEFENRLYDELGLPKAQDQSVPEEALV